MFFIIRVVFLHHRDFIVVFFMCSIAVNMRLASKVLTNDSRGATMAFLRQQDVLQYFDRIVRPCFAKFGDTRASLALVLLSVIPFP